jgi:putative acetyltransferase
VTVPLHRDPHYAFRFEDDRLVPRFHLDGVEAGRRVTVYRLDPDTGGPAGMLAEAVAGDGGWVELPEPLAVRAGQGFVAVPEDEVVIRDETPADVPAVRELNRRAFGRDAEADLVDALRAGGYARLSLVAAQGGLVVGHALFSRLTVETASGVVEALALAPVAVLPDRQRRRIGSGLIRDGLAACRGRGHRAVVVLGDAAYYPRFGFSAALAGRLRSPFPGPHFMALELVPGALAGVEGEVRYPPPFGVG